MAASGVTRRTVAPVAGKSVVNRSSNKMLSLTTSRDNAWSMCASKVPFDCVSMCRAPVCASSASNSLNTWDRCSGATKNSMIVGRSLHGTVVRRDKEFNDRWPLAPWTGDGLRAESREITLDVKRKHLRPTLPHVNLVIENLAPHLGAIALSQWEHGSRRAWHGFKSHASQLQLTNAPMARERWTRLMRLFPRDPLPMGILKTDE